MYRGKRGTADMPVLKNPRWESFAQHLASGMTKHEAYGAAGYSPNTANAAQTAKRPEIIARVAELSDRTAAKVVATKADVTNELVKNAKAAFANGQYAASTRAWELVGKDLGMFKDRFELTGKDGGAIEVADVSEAIKREIDEQFGSPAGQSADDADGNHPVVH